MARSKTYELSFQVGATLAGSFSKVFKGAESALQQVNGQLGALGKQQAANSRLMELRESLETSSLKLRAAKQNMEQLRQEMTAAGAPTKQMQQAMDKAAQAVQKAQMQVDKERAALHELNAKMGTAGTSTKQLADHQKRLAEHTEKAAKAQQKLQQIVAAQDANKAKRADMRGQLFDGVAMAATLAAPIKLAVDWEQRLAELNKVANKSPEALQEIASAATDLAVKTGVAREEIIGAYIAASQAGFAESEWAEFANVSAMMGVAFDTTGEKAGEMLKAWRAGMNLSMDEAKHLAGAVNHIANNMNATANDIGGVMRRQGAYLKSMGLSDMQAAALSATMLSGGATEETASTASKNFMRALTKGFATTKSQRKIWKMIGLDPETVAKEMQKTPQEAIVKVMKGLKKLKSHELAPAMGMLFGEESIGPAAQIVGSVDGLVEAFKLAGDESKTLTSLEEEFNSMGNTTLQQSKKAQEAIKAMTTALGVGLLEPINKALAAFAPLGLGLAKWMQANQGVVTTVVAVAGALMAAKIAAIAGGYAFTFVKGAVLSVQAAMAAARVGWLLYTGAMVASNTTSKAAIVISKAMAAAQWVLNAAMSANPIALVVVGIGALIAAGVALYKNWDAVAAQFAWSWGKMKDACQAVVDWIKGLSFYDSGMALLKTLGDGIMAAVSYPVDAIKGALAKVREYLPFSDAHVGPLSELTLSGTRVMTTLGDGMAKADIADVTAPLGGIAAAAKAGVGGGGAAPARGGDTFHITIQVPAGSDPVAARAAGSAAAESFEQKMREYTARRERLSYAPA